MSIGIQFYTFIKLYNNYSYTFSQNIEYDIDIAMVSSHMLYINQRRLIRYPFIRQKIILNASITHTVQSLSEGPFN